MCFGGGRWRGNDHGDERLHKPNAKPGARCCLQRSDTGGYYRGDPHGHAAPSRNGGKFRSRLHGLANIAKMVGSPRINGDGTASGSWNRACFQHSQVRIVNPDRFGTASKLTGATASVKYFMTQSILRRPQLGAWPAHTVRSWHSSEW